MKGSQVQSDMSNGTVARATSSTAVTTTADGAFAGRPELEAVTSPECICDTSTIVNECVLPDSVAAAGWQRSAHAVRL